jgi:glycosyltransferase involved in cell wall biosynthesis
MASNGTRFRILFVSEGYPPISGGVATSTQRIARNMVLRGADVVVYTLDTNRPLTESDYVIDELDHGVRVRRMGPFPSKHPNSPGEKVTEKVRASFRRRVFDQMEQAAHAYEPHVVLSFYLINAGLLATYLSSSLGIPHVVGVRGDDIGLHIFSVERIGAIGMIIGNASKIVCVNDYLRRRLLLPFPEAARKTHVVMNAVELPHGIVLPKARCYIERQTQWQRADSVFVFIGTPREKKGINLLLDAMDEAQARVSIRLLIVGPEMTRSDNPQLGDRWDRMKAAGLLHITGQLPRKEALEVAAEADVVVMPSIEDGLANGLLEGMALGLPPVVSDVFSDVVEDHKCGWVFSRACRKSLVAALVEASQSPDLRQTYAEAARARLAHRHNPENESTEYLRLLGAFVPGILK